MSNEVQPLWFYDRSRVVTDWSCPRKRFYNYHFGGKGIVPNTIQIELFMGTAIHDALSAIAHFAKKGEKIDADLISNAARAQLMQGLPQDTPDEQEFALEQGALVEGLIRGFIRHVWPQLISSYPDILFIEEEMEYHHDGLCFMSKPDLVLAHTGQNQVVYIEYKSTSSKKDAWINSWNTAVQLHSTIRAVLASKGVKVDQVIVQGLYKGYESYGKQSSPFCYAYKRQGTPPFSQDQISYEYKAGFKRYPTWELPGGTKAWVDGMSDEILATQFPQTPPIYLKDDLIEAFFKQRYVRESEIKLGLDLLNQDGMSDDQINDIMNNVFPQKFDQCQPSFGKGCPYRILCHSDVDPMRSGFQFREPHHLAELEAQNDSD